MTMDDANILTYPPARTYPVDAEHGALRISIVFIFIVFWIIIFLLLNALVPSEGLNILAVIISFAATAVLTQQIERALKARWPSGRALHIDQQQIRLVKNDKVEHMIDGSQRVNVLLWRFKIARRSRVPKGWYMIACALEQDDKYLPVYTFISPTDFDNLKVNQQFPILQSQKDLKRDGQSDIRLAGEQRRLHTAEQIRWMDGAEMNTEDFKKYLGSLQEHFPQWMPSVL